MLHKVSKCSFLQVFSLSPIHLNEGWKQTPAGLIKAGLIKMWLVIDETHLFYAGEVLESPNYNKAIPRGSFATELWKFDCLELFVASKEIDEPSVVYQEFNLAPNEAWWTATFDAPRVLREPQPILKGVETFAEINEQAGTASWRAALSVPLSSLPFIVNENSIMFNLCAISSTATQANYHSFVKLPGEIPDFHQPHCFFS